MLIASWNVNSIRSRLSQVISWIEEQSPDILCLQETKVLDEDFPFEPFESLGYKVKVYGQKSYNGVAILSRAELLDLRYGFNGELEIKDFSNELISQKRIISCLINNIRIINVYVPNGSSLDSDKFIFKLDWLAKLNEYLVKQSSRDEFTCIMGDFNIALSDKDIHDPHKYKGTIMASEIERMQLEKIVGDEYIDTFRIFEEGSGHWSWWDYRNNSFELNKGWRIDHIYISKNLLPMLKSSVIMKDQRGNEKPSDHAPIMINLDFQEDFEEFDQDEDIFGL